jgi:hypothetical protein
MNSMTSAKRSTMPNGDGAIDGANPNVQTNACAMHSTKSAARFILQSRFFS